MKRTVACNQHTLTSNHHSLRILVSITKDFIRTLVSDAYPESMVDWYDVSSSVTFIRTTLLRITEDTNKLEAFTDVVYNRFPSVITTISSAVLVLSRMIKLEHIAIPHTREYVHGILLFYSQYYFQFPFLLEDVHVLEYEKTETLLKNSIDIFLAKHMIVSNDQSSYPSTVTGSRLRCEFITKRVLSQAYKLLHILEQVKSTNIDQRASVFFTICSRKIDLICWREMLTSNQRMLCFPSDSISYTSLDLCTMFLDHMYNVAQVDILTSTQVSNDKYGRIVTFLQQQMMTWFSSLIKIHHISGVE